LHRCTFVPADEYLFGFLLLTSTLYFQLGSGSGLDDFQIPPHRQALSVAWLAMNDWLNDFAYRIHISGWVFVMAGLAAILIALITVSFQAIKAAVANPVKSLRSE
jgi:hypothetical protein